MSHLNSTNGVQRTSLASNALSPIAFSVKIASLRPSNTEIAEAVYKRFGITRDDMPQLKKLFGGVDPIAFFTRTLERNPRSTVTRDGVTTTRISLSAQDYANLERAGKTIRDAKGAPSADANQQPSSQPQGETFATRQGYNQAAHQRAALETKLTTRQTDAPQQSDDKNQEGIGAFLDGVVRGDFSGNESWSATAGKIIGGLNPLADARDTVAAIKNVAQGKEGSGIGLVAAGIGWIPGVGDAGKAAIKAGRKALKEGAEEIAEVSAERAVKEGAVEGSERAAKEAVQAGRVAKPGGRPDLRDTYRTDADVPAHYRNDPRFKDLASDPAHGGAVKPSTRAEAMAGLEAETQGLVKSPITRGPKETEFYDADGRPWDVKAPPSPKPGEKFVFSAKESGNSIRKELRQKGVPPGTFPNEKSGLPEPRRVILDTTYMNEADHTALRDWLTKNLTAEELNRIVEINTRP